MIQTKDFNYRGAAFLGRQFIHPPFDRFDNKSYLSNPYSFPTHVNKSSRYDSLNNSHILTTAKEKRISPLRSGYIETETPRDTPANLSERRSARLKTDESEKIQQLIDSSYDSTYIQKLKNATENRKKFPLANNNTRALSNNRTGRYNMPTRDHPSPIRSTGESIVDPKGKNMHQYLKTKRTSAQVGKNLSYSYVDAGLPVLYAHGNTRLPREKVASTRVSSINSEMIEFQSLDTPNLALKIPKKSELSRFSQPVERTPGIFASDNAKAFKFRMKSQEQQYLLPQKYPTDIAEACYLSTNLRNSESFMGEYILSPARDNSKESHEHTPQILRKNVNLLEAVNSSLTSKNRGENSASIDDGFEKVNELTNKNNLARYDLLRIQESALELKMLLGRRKSQRPNKDNNKVVHSFVDELIVSDSMFRVDSEI